MRGIRSVHSFQELTGPFLRNHFKSHMHVVGGVCERFHEHVRFPGNRRVVLVLSSEIVIMLILVGQRRYLCGWTGGLE